MSWGGLSYTLCNLVPGAEGAQALSSYATENGEKTKAEIICAGFIRNIVLVFVLCFAILSWTDSFKSPQPLKTISDWHMLQKPGIMKSGSQIECSDSQVICSLSGQKCICYEKQHI